MENKLTREVNCGKMFLLREEEVQMEIHYATEKDKKIFTSERLIKKYYGKIANSLAVRLSELRVADNLSDIPQTPPPRRHKLGGDYQNCWGLNVSKNFRMILEPVGEYDVNDVTSIREVKIIRIEDYH